MFHCHFKNRTFAGLQSDGFKNCFAGTCVVILIPAIEECRERTGEGDVEFPFHIGGGEKDAPGPGLQDGGFVNDLFSPFVPPVPQTETERLAVAFIKSSVICSNTARRESGATHGGGHVVEPETERHCLSISRVGDTNLAGE